jgi:hypothetical protein
MAQSLAIEAASHLAFNLPRADITPVNDSTSCSVANDLVYARSLRSTEEMVRNSAWHLEQYDLREHSSSSSSTHAVPRDSFGFTLLIWQKL